MTIRLSETGWLTLAAILCIASIACTPSTPVVTPGPFTIEVGPSEPTLDISNCATIVCCSDCPDIPVDRIIDGATFQSANARIRLFGVDTPERGERCYDEAAHRLRELAGDSVRVEFGPRHGDSYGRILHYVYTSESTSIDEILVREGLALAWRQDGQQRDILIAAEEGARRENLGCLWRNDRNRDST